MFLLELVVDLVTAMPAGRSDHAGRSVVGESDLDRSSQVLWIWVLGVILCCVRWARRFGGGWGERVGM